MLSYKDITTDIRQLVIEQYLLGNNPKQFAQSFDMHPDIAYQILYEANLVKTREYVPHYRNRCIEWKQAVADYYLEPHTRFETKNFFRTSDRIVSMVIEELNLPKRTQAEELRIVHTHTFGSHEAYVEHMVAEQRKTSTEKYGVDNFAKSPMFNKQCEATCMEKYGVKNPMQAPHIKQQLSDNCLEKYGVPWPCMRDEARTSAGGKNSGPNCAFNNELLKVFSEDQIQREFRLENYSYDFKIGNVLIEIDPIPTHNSTWNPHGGDPLQKEYHKRKSDTAKAHGYRCIHIWDWDKFSSIIKLLLPRLTIYARKCTISSIDKTTTKQFLINNHLQGYAQSSIDIGLFYNDELVSVMTFGKPRYNQRYEYELIRYCSIYNVIGGAEKLFSYFVKTYRPKSIVSYCDESKFEGKTYEKLGFTYKDSSISKHWAHPKDARHITDNLLRQRGFDQLLGKEFGCYGKGTRNDELMLKHGFVEIYDAGQATYVWEN